MNTYEMINNLQIDLKFAIPQSKQAKRIKAKIAYYKSKITKQNKMIGGLIYG